jgi:hypothetical protein
MMRVRRRLLKRAYAVSAGFAELVVLLLINGRLPVLYDAPRCSDSYRQDGDFCLMFCIRVFKLR